MPLEAGQRLLDEVSLLTQSLRSLFTVETPQDLLALTRRFKLVVGIAMET
jgi:hypothetical protein